MKFCAENWTFFGVIGAQICTRYPRKLTQEFLYNITVSYVRISLGNLYEILEVFALITPRTEFEIPQVWVRKFAKERC